MYLDFDATYGVKVYGKYYAPNTTSYNMSFHNTQTSSVFPFIGVTNVGDFIIHIDTIGDILRVKKDKNVEIVDGDLIGTATGNFPKARMNDIYCRNIYAEPIVISNGSSSSAYILMYEDSDNGTNYTKLQALASIGSNNTITLPEQTGNLIIDTQPLEISPTNSSSFYIAKFLASSISNSNSVEMVLGKANSSKNCSTFQYYHTGDDNAGNYLQIGIKTIA